MAKLGGDSPGLNFTRKCNILDVTNQLLGLIPDSDEAAAERGKARLDRAIEVFQCWPGNAVMPWDTSSLLSRDYVATVLGMAYPSHLLDMIAQASIPGVEELPVISNSENPDHQVLFEQAAHAMLDGALPEYVGLQRSGVDVTWLAGASPSKSIALAKMRQQQRESVVPLAEGFVSLWLLFIFACNDTEKLKWAKAKATSKFVRANAEFALNHL